MTANTTDSTTHERFDALADAWEAHCRANSERSDPRVFVEHPSFDSIVGLGAIAVPWIVERYKTGPLFWGAALARITGDTSKGDGVSGDLKETRRRWLTDARA